MDKELIAKYGVWAAIAAVLIMQWNIFVTPAQLEEKHRVILQEVSQIYTTKETSNNFKSQLDDMQKKIDKIYDKIIINK